MRLLIQYLIPALIFFVLFYLLWNKSGNRIQEHAESEDPPGQVQTLSIPAILLILAICALVTIASIFGLQLLLD